MDKSTQDYLDQYYHQLDEWLQQELKEIEERHLKNGTFGNKEYWDECKTVTSGIEFKKEELKARVLSAQGATDLQKLESKKDKLILCRNGQTIYFAKSGRKYQAKLSTETNAYKLIKQLAFSFQQLIHCKELAKYLKFKSTEDRVVRDTIQYIRNKKLKLLKEDDFFIVDRALWGLKCDVELRVS